MTRKGFAAAVVAAALLAGCGEPAVDLDLPAREPGQQVLDLAGILDAGAVGERLDALRAHGLDVVAVTYETAQSSCGEAFRAGGELVEAWDADVALVAVAAPGDFTATGDDRERCLGVRPRDDRAVPGDLRERIAEQIVPPLAAGNDWAGAFVAAADALAEVVR